MATNDQKTWMPITAGILNIIVGAIGALSAFGLIIAIIVTSDLHFVTAYIRPQDIPFALSILTIILIIILVFTVVEAVFPIIGGVFALQRRRWGWALAGSIVSIIGILPLGIAATIFVAMSKDEFE